MAFTVPRVHGVTRVSAKAETYSRENGQPFGNVDITFHQRDGESAVLEVYTMDIASAYRIADALNAAFAPAEQEPA